MHMSGYTKLFNSILHSTIWNEGNETRIVWITMLAMADKEGNVQASIPGLAKMAGVSIADTEAALKKFQEPDQYSRTPEFEGRRIKPCDGGWTLLNHGKYRRLMSTEERREYNRQKQAEYRQRKKDEDGNESITVNDSEQCQHIAEAEAEADTDTKEEEKKESASEEFETAWNSLPEPFPKIRAMTGSRKSSLRERMKEPFWREHWRTALDRMSKSSFCRGQNDRKWIGDVDFFLRPDSVAKIMEGKYDQKKDAQSRFSL